MTEKLKSDVKIIRAMLHQSYQTGGKLLATLEDPASSPVSVAKLIDAMCLQLERGVVEARNLCENDRPNELAELGKPGLPHIDVAGRVDVDRWGWLHIELNSLLPNCRFAAPVYLTDTISRLLDEYENRGLPLPRYESAMLVIDEHCDIDSRCVYDQDNKNWKAIPNVLKGRVIKDDDQFTLSVSLISTKSATPACHIYLLPQNEAGEFFSLKHENYLFFH